MTPRITLPAACLAQPARTDAGESRADCLMRLVEIFEGLGR